jgi:hypothetical protein
MNPCKSLQLYLCYSIMKAGTFTKHLLFDQNFTYIISLKPQNSSALCADKGTEAQRIK